MSEELSESAKEARRKYIREWRKKNPDKVREYNRSHWERVAKRAAEQGAADSE